MNRSESGFRPVMWSAACLVVALAAGCGGGGEAGQDTAPVGSVPAIAPTVSGTSSANGATNDAVNTRIGATFSEPMDASTITSATFFLMQGTTVVPGVVSYSGASAVLAPSSALLPGTRYAATIRGGAARPELLRSERKIDWATALEFDSKADLIEHLIERYTYEFGMSNISQKVALFSKQMGLKIPTEHIDIQHLESAEQIRHIIVHNGSRVSQEFVERTKRKDARIGERVPVSIGFVRQTIEEVTSLAITIFLGMSEKFFDAHEIKCPMSGHR